MPNRRPQLEIVAPSASPEEAAAVVAALERFMRERPATGVAIAFGPGLAMEGIRFGWTEGDAG